MLVVLLNGDEWWLITFQLLFIHNFNNKIFNIVKGVNLNQAYILNYNFIEFKFTVTTIIIAG